MSNIQLERLAKKYGNQVAVADLDLSINSGEFVVLVGPSGCGKTTTLRMIAGFVEPTTGRILIGDRVVNALPPRLRDIGMVFQDYALFPNMTVRQNIAFGLEEHGASHDRTRKRVGEMLDLVRLGAFEDRFPAELSGGQQQRVALARALAYEPRVLLMDEPLGALDQKLREEMQREFANIQRKLGITTVFVTHDQQEAMALADRIVVMHDGRADQIGSPDEIYRQPATLFSATFIGRSNILSGEVVAVTGDMSSLRMASGNLIQGRTIGTLKVGDKSQCVVRPEQLRIVPTAAATSPTQNTIRAEIRRRSYLGSFVDLVCASDDCPELIVQLPPKQEMPVAIGSTVYLEFSSHEVFCFPVTGAARERATRS